MLVLPLGALSGHQLGYFIGGGGHGAVGHGYLGDVVTAAVLLTVVAVSITALRAGSGAGRRSLGHLIAGQAAVFLAMETIEHLVSGAGLAGLAGSPAVWLGLVAQLLTGVLAHVSLARIAGAGRGWAPSRAWLGDLALQERWLAVVQHHQRTPRAGIAWLAALRAPPALTP